MSKTSDFVNRQASLYKIYFFFQNKMEDLANKPMWPRRNLYFLTFFLYTCFVVSSFIIPDTIAFGEWLSFAFTFSMMQMVETALFLRFENWQNFILLCLSLLIASVLPSFQIFLVMQGDFSVQSQNMCGYIYMLKELILYFFHRGSFLKTSLFFKAHIVVIIVWIILEFLCQFVVTDLESDKNFLTKMFCILRLSPLFCMGCFTFLRMTKGVNDQIK